MPWIPGIVLTALLWVAAPSRAAEPATYALDPVHTRVVFAIDHAGFSKAVGAVSGSTGTLRFDPDDWTTATLEAQVPLTRLDLGDAKWNQATLAGNLLDGDDHPVALFVSTRVEPVAADRARVYGLLSLRGVEKEIVLDVTLNALKRHPLPPFRRTIGFSATASLSRADFGMSAWKSVIGDIVELRIEAEATRTRDDGSDDGTEATPVETPSVDDAAPPPEPEAEPQPESAPEAQSAPEPEPAP